MTSQDQNPLETSHVFQGEEEIVGRYAYQSGIVSSEELEQLKHGNNLENLVPGFSGPHAVREKGRTTIINLPTHIGEKDFPTRILIKEPGFATRALAKLVGKPAFIKAEKRRALHAVHYPKVETT